MSNFVPFFPQLPHESPSPQNIRRGFRPTTITLRKNKSKQKDSDSSYSSLSSSSSSLYSPAPSTATTLPFAHRLTSRNPTTAYLNRINKYTSPPLSAPSAPSNITHNFKRRSVSSLVNNIKNAITSPSSLYPPHVPSNFSTQPIRPHSSTIRSIHSANYSLGPKGNHNKEMGEEEKEIHQNIPPSVSMSVPLPDTERNYFSSSANGARPSSAQIPKLMSHSSEYVKNLHEQIEYLQLELSLLKQHPSLLTKSSPSSSSIQPSSNESIESVLSQLRQKCVNLESSHREECRSLSQLNKELSHSHLEKETELHQVKDALEKTEIALYNMAKENKEKRQIIFMLEMKEEKRETHLQSTLGQNKILLESLEQELRTVRIESDLLQQRRNEEREEFLEQMSRAEKQTQTWIKRERIAAERLIELEQKLRENPPESILISNQLKELQTERIDLEAELQRANSHWKSEKEKVSALEQTIEDLIENEKKLSASLIELSAELKERDDREEEERRGRVYWSSEIVQLKRQVERREDEYKQAEDKLQNLQVKLTDLQEENATLRHVLREEEEKQQKQKGNFDSSISLSSPSPDLNNELFQLRSENSLLQTDLGVSQSAYRKIQSEFSALERLTITLQARISTLTEENNSNQIFRDLNIQELVGMASSNLKVTAAIEALVRKFNSSTSPQQEEEMNPTRKSSQLNWQHTELLLDTREGEKGDRICLQQGSSSEEFCI